MASGDAEFLRYHQFKVSGVMFECPAHLTPIKPIGKGAYGIVCSATDTRTSEKVAIKKIGGIFDNPLDAKRTLREIRILRHLHAGQRHANIISLRDLFPPPSNARNFRDLYMVTELMDTDLHQIIRSPQPLSDDHAAFFIYQLLRGLKYLHSADVVHRDLKPSNLLLNGNCDLKICDFGLARAGLHSGEQMAEYVVTRWYRAPELLLSCSDYGPAIDMWSVGCIFAELLGRKPLFPGKDYLHQIALISKVIGTPSEADIAAVRSQPGQEFLRSLPPTPPADMGQIFPSASAKGLDLLEGLLTFDPGHRLTVEQALAHPYFESLHDPGDEPRCPSPFVDPAPEDQTVPQIRAGIFSEMVAFNPEVGLL